MNLIEEWGTGIPRIVREMEEYGLQEPEFIDMEVAFRVNLYRSGERMSEDAGECRENAGECRESAKECRKSAAKVPQKCRKMPESAGKMPESVGKVPEQQEQIYQVILENGYITTVEVAQILGVKQRRARSILKYMAEIGMIRKVGESRSTRYVLPEGE